VSAEFRLGVSHRLPVDELRALARKGGVRLLRDEALILVQRGLIEFGELRDLLTSEALSGGIAPHATGIIP
jgi:hypothetical protein